MAQTKAVAKRDNNAVVLSDNDKSIYAQCVQLSKSSAVPMAYIGKPDQIFSTVIYGREFGLGAMSSLCNIFNVNGKPSMNVHIILGLCMKHKEFAGYEIKVHTDKECKVVMYRYNFLSKKAFPYEGSWSMEEAVAAGLMSSSMYKKYPKNMLFARAATFAARKAFPDMLGGLYSVEEIASEELTEEAIEQLEAFEVGGGTPPSTSSSPSKPKRTPVKVEPAKAATKPALKKLAPNR